MSELLFKQFELTRGSFLKTTEGITTEQASVQPEGFNNNIHWHIGHVLTVTEQFMMGFPKKSSHLPVNYIELFGNGTRPSDWTGDVPSVEVLRDQLKAQLGRIKEIPPSMLDEKLKKPFLGMETFGELANMSLFHEAYHLGQIHVMRKLVK
ncbi:MULTISPECIES: DinB family protein [unclassified Bacillus (in: firmicutes)]|uniref:DinB family protein n=1 Tax=unclassified Bacillus (in: firmicutes) TaxID=185979 RepID=UPI001BE91213|nr:MULTISPECIES: DinB family protein [unclassified Bacillus (in: firmicutes)]MBT2637832.1 DinB family protein [Bacillus sp. ISL-39]MBT2659744.1 DinB family protein [Bacillus sp. ISL-45]